MVAQPSYGLSTDTTLGGNSPSDIISPSEKAIKTYVDNNKGASTLNELSGVTVTSPVSGQVLGYNGYGWANTVTTKVTIRDWSS